jgi:site-specific recombinase XerD
MHHKFYLFYASIGSITLDRKVSTRKKHIRVFSKQTSVHPIPMQQPKTRTTLQPEQKRCLRRQGAITRKATKSLNIADLRERVVITLLALGGFRIGTLSKLQYRHVKRDLEPIHIHVESEITKGKYHDYDTFLGQEAAEYLKAYLDIRRQGSPTGRKHPEIINDDSPLIRDGQSNIVRPITEGRIHSIVHNLYVEAGLVTKNPRDAAMTYEPTAYENTSEPS